MPRIRRLLQPASGYVRSPRIRRQQPGVLARERCNFTEAAAEVVARRIGPVKSMIGQPL